MATPVVFVVDDDPAAACGLAAVLVEETGFDVQSFTSSSAARAAAAQRSPDAVIADLRMPAPAGLALLELLAGDDPHLVGLVMTSESDDDGIAAARAEVGPLRHVLKPWQLSDVLPKLLAGLERRTLTQELERSRASLQQHGRALQASHRRIDETAAKLASTHTELEVATARLVEAEQLAAVGRVVTGIAHEISDQLALVGYAEAIKSRVDDASELYEFADAIVHAQKRLAAMVDQIRDFAVAAVPNAEPPRREPASLVAIVDGALSILRYDRNLRARNLVRRYRGHPLVLLNREQFDQVVINLVSNAVLATEPGDTLRVEIDSDDARGQAILTVCDAGEGMPPEVLSRLGEAFFTTRGDRGSGLGVGICMRIVEAHGGSVVYCSQPGSGTTVRVRLPLLDQTARSAT